jgi:hypothetical protein
MTLIRNELRTFWKANEAFAKHRKAKCTHL